MKYTSFSDALEHIRNSSEVLSLSVASLLLDILHDIPDAGMIHQRCHALTQKYCRGDWLKELPLCDLMVAVSVRHRYGQFDGGQMATVVKRLLDAESQVGGPYRNEYGELDIETNVAVLYFARTTGISLPNVEEYIQNKGHMNPWQQYMVYEKIPDLTRITGESIETAALALLSFSRADKRAGAHAQGVDLYGQIAKGIEKQLTTLSQPLQAAAYEVYEKIRRADKNQEIALISTFFGECLKIAPDTVDYVRLGRANFYIWMAYTVYDGFLDGEGKPKHLSAAHMAVREAFRQYASIMANNKQFSEVLSETLVKMDEANAWEVEYCRLQVVSGRVNINALPQYSRRTQLATRSFAHALGPLALVAERLSLTSRQAKYINDGFKHYLIARQLDDDAHDWLEDMKIGQVSFVVAHILRQLRLRPGVYELDELLPRMKRHFWRHSAVQVCHITLQHIELAREAFDASGVVVLKGQFAGLLTKIEDSARQTCARQESEHKFMDAYRILNVK